MRDEQGDVEHDVIIIGSGFGGAMAAHVLVNAGRDVLMLERGDWVPRDERSWDPDSAMELGPAYSTESAYRVVHGGDRPEIGSLFCVGGPSVFFGAVTSRFRAQDFDVCDEIALDSGARWPLTYADLEPYYERAEHILGVTGDSGVDPTEPPRRTPLPRTPGGLSPISRRIDVAARSIGLTTFRLPLAINHTASAGRAACVRCGTCDCFACAISAKNDVATAVIEPLLTRGLQLRTNTIATQLEVARGRIVAVRCAQRLVRDDTTEYREVRLRARSVILSAGALASPHLLLASGLEQANPAGHAIGRYLLRHCNALVYGIFWSDLPDPRTHFHKELGIHDFYFGDRAAPTPELGARIGSLQSVHPPPPRLVERHVPRALGALAAPVLAFGVRRATGLLAIAEDQPQKTNRVWVDDTVRDACGLPRLQIEHHYSARDERARIALVDRAKRILRAAGAKPTVARNIQTFSHAAGTVRMGDDPRSAPLDASCRFRGIDNLHVIDASCMPTVAAVNPSLTIAALALRAAESVVA
jgi:choline dehydrogenase-like flavoprotein